MNMLRLLLCLCLLSFAACTQAVLTPFEEPQPPQPEERVFVTMAAEEFEFLPDGTLFFLEIPEWEVLGVPAFVMDGLLVADFSVPTSLFFEGAPVQVLLVFDDPSLCVEMSIFDTVGFAFNSDAETRTAEFQLEPMPVPGLCE